MTCNDLRRDYKRDTGTDANSPISREVEVDCELSINELLDEPVFDVDLDPDDVPYIEWLEEKLIKLLAK